MSNRYALPTIHLGQWIRAIGLCMLLCAKILVGDVQAQASLCDTVSIGSGNNTNNFLWGYSYYNYSFTEQIYRQSELGSAMALYGMAVEVGTASHSRDISIYLGHTNQSSVDSWILPGDLTLVWSGVTQYTANSWNDILFETPFLYNGRDNLLLLIIDNTGSYEFSPHNSVRIHTNTGYYSRYVYNDYTPYSTTAVPSSPGSSITSRTNVRWYGCSSSCGFINNIASIAIGSNSAFISWNLNNALPSAQVLIEYDDDPAFASPQRDTVSTTPPYALTGLLSNTNYYVRASILCEDGMGLFSTTQFSTTAQPCTQYGSLDSLSIGTGTTTSSTLWGNSFYNYSFTEQIYRQEELGGASTISGMAVQLEAVDTNRVISIYLGHTDQSSVSSWIIPEDITMVWSGRTRYTANSWNNISFSEPFAFNGVDNLLLLVIDQTGDWWSSIHNNICTHSNGNYNSRYYANDGTFYEPTNPPSSGSTTNYRANVRWYTHHCISQNVCESLAILVSDITDHEAVVRWTETNTTAYRVFLGTHGETPTLIATLDTTAYTLTGLESDTRYTVYVLPDCITDIPLRGYHFNFHTDCGESAGICINYNDLYSCRVECRHGNFSNPDRDLGVIDRGSASSSSSHTIHSDPNETDQRTGHQLHTVPDGYATSVRLGNWETGYGAESIRYRYKVDTTISDLLILKYAAVLQDPNHTAAEQPRFTFRITDEDGNDLNAACYSANYIANSSLGWNSNGSVLWKDWTTVGVSLNPFHGQTIYIKLTTYDCDQGGHYGYAYFVIDCGNKQISSSACGDVVENTYTAPAGFNYRWYRDETPGTTLATTQSYHSTQAGVYHCELSFVGASNTNCSSVLTAISGSRYPYSRFSFSYEDTNTSDCNVQVRFTNNSVITSDLAHNQLTSLPCEQYLWRFGDGTTSTLINPIHTFPEGTHTVTLLAMLSNGECIDSASTTIQISGICQTPSGREERTICDNELPYTWNDVVFQTAGEQMVTLTTPAGIDSLVTMVLHVNPTYAETVTETICSGTPYVFEGETYTDSGTYVRHLTTGNNCDSMRTLVLHVMQTSHIVDTRNVCDSLTWHGTTYTESTQTPTYHSTNTVGCDSITTLHLTVRHSNSGIDVQNVCDALIWHGTTYTESTQTPTYHSTNAAGCDSVTTLHLTIRHSSSVIDTHDICDSLNWHGTTYRTSTQTPTYHSTNAEGCDSVITLHLTVRHSSSVIDTHDICDSLNWHGTTYRTSTQTPTYQSTNAAGCDSVTTLHLTIRHSNSGIDVQNVCDALIWHGTTYTESTQTPTYHSTNAAGCDSVTTLHLTIRHSSSVIDTHDICDSLNWHGTTYRTSTQTPTYQSTNAAGCDSVTTLHLTIRHSNSGIDVQNVCDALVWHGTTYTESTQTPTYQSTNAAGCDSVTTLHLTIRHSSSVIDTHDICDSLNWHGTTYRTSTQTPTYHSTNAEGCDSVITLHLTIRHSNSGIDVQNVCDALVWHGTTYTESTQTPTYQSTNAAGCDSVTTLHLTIRHSSSVIDTHDICDSLNWHGTTYRTSTQTPTYHSTNAEGCDSVITLHLTVRHSSSVIDTHDICDSLNWHGTTYRTSTQTPTYHSTNVEGCDSVTTLHLTVRHSNSGIDVQNVCDALIWHGTTYHNSTQTPTYHSTNAAGCDSVITLHLTVRHSNSGIDVQNVCDALAWHGTTYTESTQTPTYHSTNAAGCDSVTTLHLTIRHSSSVIDTHDICDSLNWHGTTYRTSTQTPTYHSTNAEGCDSVITLHLTIRHSNSGIDVQNVCDALAWHGTTYTESTQTPTYQSTNAAGCDSITTLHLTIRHSSSGIDVQNVCDALVWHGTTYTESTQTPTYQSTNAAGCDSVTTLHLTIRHSSSVIDTHDICDSLNWHGTTYRTSTQTPTYHSTNAEGCDSVTTLHLTVRHSNSGIDVQNVCDALIWHGTTYTESTQTPTYHSTNAAGCDSVTTLHLTIRHSSSVIDTHDICDSLNWHGTTYRTSTQTPTYHSTNAAGCDSVITLHLTVRHRTSVTDTYTVCDSLTWHGTTYHNSTQTPTYHSTNAAGCDSITTLHLTVRHSSSGIDVQNMCDALIWHGTTYTESTQTPTYHSTNAAGCDSVTTLHLTIRHSSSVIDTHDICDSLNWHGTTYRTSTQTPTFHSTNAEGCDSVTTLHLTVRHRTSSIDTYTVCDSLTWHGTTHHNSTQTPTYHSTNAVGCDSTTTLHLTVNHGSHTTSPITACEQYVWHNETYDEDGTYRHDYPDANGCSSSETLVLHIVHETHQAYDVTECIHFLWHDTDYTLSGTYRCNYTNADGCASTDTLHLTVLEASHSDTSAEACVQFRWNRDGHTYTASGTYQYEYLNAVGCTSQDVLHLTIHPAYDLHLSDTICQGESYTFGDELHYEGGEYGILLQSRHGCDSSVTLHLSVRPSPEVSISSEYSCSRETWWLSAVSNGDSFTWRASHEDNQLEGHEHDIIVKLRPREETTVTLTADYRQGHSCPNSTQITLEPITNVVAAISCHPEVLRPGNRMVEVTDMSSGHTTRQWYVDGVSWGTSPVINCEADDEAEELIITLIAYNNLCSDTAEKHLYPAEETLFVPNVFTPSLSTNSTFRVYGTGILEYHITIYTREGQLVYSGDGLDSEWDGTHNDEPCPQGNYVYHIRFRGRSVPDGWQNKSGSLLLLR